MDQIQWLGKGTYSFLHSSLYLTSSVLSSVLQILQISPEQVFQYFFLLKGKKKNKNICVFQLSLKGSMTCSAVMHPVLL